MDLMTSLATKTGKRKIGHNLSKIAGIEEKYKDLASRSRGDNSPTAVKEDLGLVVTGWKGLAPVKKGIVVAFYHMASPSSYDNINFADLADKNEFIVVNEWRMDDKFGAATIVEMSLKKAGIPFKKRTGRR